jgi:hypothetical protein
MKQPKELLESTATVGISEDGSINLGVSFESEENMLGMIEFSSFFAIYKGSFCLRQSYKRNGASSYDRDRVSIGRIRSMYFSAGCWKKQANRLLKRFPQYVGAFYEYLEEHNMVVRPSFVQTCLVNRIKVRPDSIFLCCLDNVPTDVFKSFVFGGPCHICTWGPVVATREPAFYGRSDDFIINMVPVKMRKYTNGGPEFWTSAPSILWNTGHNADLLSYDNESNVIVYKRHRRYEHSHSWIFTKASIGQYVFPCGSCLYNQCDVILCRMLIGLIYEAVHNGFTPAPVELHDILIEPLGLFLDSCMVVPLVALFIYYISGHPLHYDFILPCHLSRRDIWEILMDEWDYIYTDDVRVFYRSVIPMLPSIESVLFFV